MTVFEDGLQTRRFCYVSDHVEGLCALMLSVEVFPANPGNPREASMIGHGIRQAASNKGPGGSCRTSDIEPALVSGTAPAGGSKIVLA